MENCLFCKIIDKKIPANIIDENEHVIVILSLENHPLIVPKKHIVDVYTLDEASASAVMNEAVKISKAVKDSTKCDGINLVQSNGTAAGQDVFHFHLHIKPRWKGDNVTLHWETNSVSEEQRFEFATLLKESFK